MIKNIFVINTIFRATAITLLFFGLLAPDAQGKITIEGTEEEKKEIQEAIDELKNSSQTAKELYEELENRSEEVVIRFGDTIDIATADVINRRVVIRKNTIEKFKLIKNDQGGGKALEQADLKYIIAHEALGHILNNLKNQPFHEAAALATVNRIRVEADSVPRTKSHEIKDGKVTIPFGDGSSVDVTDALKMGTSRTGGRPFIQIQQNGLLNLLANIEPLDKVSLTLDSPSSFDLLLPPEVGGGTEVVDVIDFQALLSNSTDTEPFNLVVEEFELIFSSFDINGISTGINQIGLINPWRTPIGEWNFSDIGSDFSFSFSGDFLWTNDLFEEGYVVESFEGLMIANNDSWFGTATVEGSKFGIVPVPEPSSRSGLLAFGALGTVLGLKHKQKHRQSDNSAT